MFGEFFRLMTLCCYQVGCCGVTEPADWQHTQWGRGHPDRLPHSCCSTTTTGVCREQQAGARLYLEGCHPTILHFLHRHSSSLVCLLLATTLLHGAAVLSSFCLARTRSPYSQLAWDRRGRPADRWGLGLVMIHPRVLCPHITGYRHHYWKSFCRPSCFIPLTISCAKFALLHQNVLTK